MTDSLFLLRAGLPALVLAAACSASPPPQDDAVAAAPAATEAAAPVAVANPAPPPMSPVLAGADTILVHKSPTCGCCTKWVDHLRANGFQVDVVETNDLPAVQARVGVPAGKGNCHTAEVAGYFVEGHVPAQDIHRLLAEKPDARGLTVPGMPLGSPGMEAPGHEQPYAVLLVAKDGSASEYAAHGPGAD